MSFLRHQEIYQVRHVSPSDKRLIERAQPYDRALTHRLDESPVGYSWRVALQQSPLLLHQPAATLRQLQRVFQVECSPLGDPHLNLLSHFLTHRML
jgi:hypothetical protein